MYTHIFLVYLGMTFRGVFPSIISPLTSFSSSQIADREQKCHVECKKIESGLLTFTVFEMLRKTKKPLQLMGKSEKAQINE